MSLPSYNPPVAHHSFQNEARLSISRPFIRRLSQSPLISYPTSVSFCSLYPSQTPLRGPKGRAFSLQAFFLPCSLFCWPHRFVLGNSELCKPSSAFMPEKPFSNPTPAGIPSRGVITKFSEGGQRLPRCLGLEEQEGYHCPSCFVLSLVQCHLYATQEV